MPTSNNKQIPQRHHSCNEHYFDTIDTEEKAYWLGVLWADGCITKTAKRAKGPNRLNLTQKLQNTQHLKKFKTAIQGTYPIKEVQAGWNKTVSSLNINSRILCEALIQYGFGNKNQRTKLPPISSKMKQHFIRGYFDGDGCLSIYDQIVKQWTIHRQEWSLTGNPLFIAEMKKELEIHCNVTKSVKIKKYSKTDQCVSLRYGKKEDICKLYEYMYANATIWLEEKRAKFEQFFSRKNERN